jgi:hypothetical protein
VSLLLFIQGRIIYFNYRRVIQSFNGVGCKLFTFTSDIINGEQKTELPKWIGVNGIINKLDDTVTTLQQIADNSDSAFTNTDWTKTEPPKFVQRLKDIYTGYKDKTLTNPNPANSLKNGFQTLKPVYINNLGDYSVTNS